MLQLAVLSGKNITTGETSQAITPFQFFDYFNFYHKITQLMIIFIGVISILTHQSHISQVVFSSFLDALANLSPVTVYKLSAKMYIFLN